MLVLFILLCFKIEFKARLEPLFINVQHFLKLYVLI